ncbi:periplasmic solute binding protein family [Gemella morbillorum M424]|uniref:Metal ABC transporter substrate-binding protein n=1 Tax=Gemella morbillorum TaxID=29391 RepID=A0AAP9HCR1_9BACL|nr:zinc ABC transporter substrate-binding protein [Gemella morbillorum]EFV36068.1 periplasmic solute binding protein family [Gemella morbillorum M424]QGS09375.1 metal ABC transporter substrate-binding protein [Gemella morbillorum]
MSKFLKFLSIITALTLFLVGCSSKTNSNPTSTEKIKIVTSVNFYAEVAKAVAGDKAEVSSIISSSIDPHDFEPTAQDAKTVADSKIAILNGGGYDSWFEKLTNNSKNITKIDGAKLLGLKEGENEHIWYNPEVMSKIADELTKILSEKDSSNKDFYEKNRDKYKKELSKITEKINSLKEKANGKSVLTTEPVFEYAVKSLGLKVSDEVNKLAQATEEGNDPAPQDLKNIQQQIKKKQISLIINNVQTTNKTVEGLINLAEQNNIPILNVTETQPDGKTYIEWMLDQYNKLEEILNGGKGEKAYHTEDAKESHSHDHEHDHEGHDHNHEGHNHNH